MSSNNEKLAATWLCIRSQTAARDLFRTLVVFLEDDPVLVLRGSKWVFAALGSGSALFQQHSR